MPDEIVQWLKSRSGLLAGALSRFSYAWVCDERWHGWQACAWSTREQKKFAKARTLAEYVDVRLLLSQVLRQYGHRCHRGERGEWNGYIIVEYKFPHNGRKPPPHRRMLHTTVAPRQGPYGYLGRPFRNTLPLCLEGIDIP